MVQFLPKLLTLSLFACLSQAAPKGVESLQESEPAHQLEERQVGGFFNQSSAVSHRVLSITFLKPFGPIAAKAISLWKLSYHADVFQGELDHTLGGHIENPNDGGPRTWAVGTQKTTSSWFDESTNGVSGTIYTFLDWKPQPSYLVEVNFSWVEDFSATNNTLQWWVQNQTSVKVNGGPIRYRVDYTLDFK